MQPHDRPPADVDDAEQLPLMCVDVGLPPRPANVHIDRIAKRKPGRPRKERTRVVTVRISERVYAAYKSQAAEWLEEVGTVLRGVITAHAPKS